MINKRSSNTALCQDDVIDSDADYSSVSELGHRKCQNGDCILLVYVQMLHFINKLLHHFGGSFRKTALLSLYSTPYHTPCYISGFASGPT